MRVLAPALGLVLIAATSLAQTARVQDEATAALSPTTAGGAAAQPCQGPWVWGSVLPQGNGLKVVKHVPGIGFVAVGRGGAVVTSQDGASWTARSSGVTGDLLSLAYGNGVFVAVGSQGSFQTEPRTPLIVSSPDGITWTRRDRPEHGLIPGSLAGIAFDGARFVAVSTNQQAWVSPDGVEWPSAGADMAGAAHFYASDVAWTGDRFVAIGAGGVKPLEVVGTILLASPDGRTWHLEMQTERDFTSLAVGGGKVLAYGIPGVLTSLTPGSWTKTRISEAGQPTGLVWTGENFLLRETTWQADHPWRLLESTTGSSWTAVDATGLDQYAGSLGAGGGLVVAVGDNGALATSPDGSGFTSRTTRVPVDLVDVAWTGQRYVAVGYGAILTSEDGASWQPQAGGEARTLAAVTAGPGMVVAMDTNGDTLTSPDGITWTSHPTGLNASFTSVEIVWATSRFIAVGSRYDQPSGTVLSSPDGAIWVRLGGAETPPLAKLVWTGTRLVGLAFGKLLTSPDGVAWSEIPKPDLIAITSLAARGETVVAIGFHPSCDVICCGCCQGVAAVSNDLVTWQRSDWLAGELFDVTSDGARFVAAGRCGLVTSSRDGLAWSIERGMGAGLEMAAVASSTRSTAFVGINTLVARTPCREPGTLRRRLTGSR